jgi:hypothetical protein
LRTKQVLFLFFLHSYQKGCVAVAFDVFTWEVSGSNIGQAPTVQTPV